jgi:hypothetical protein
MNAIEFLRERIRRFGLRAAQYAAFGTAVVSMSYWAGYRGNLQSWGDSQPFVRVIKFFTLAYPIAFTLVLLFC